MGVGLYGPPIPGAPWLGRPASVRPPGFRPPSQADPPLPLIGRVRERDEAVRLRRVIDQLVTLVNALIRTGQLELTGIEEWAVNLDEGLATAPRFRAKRVLEADLPDDALDGEVAVTTDTKRFCWRVGGVWYCVSQDAVEEAAAETTTARLVPFGLLLALTKRA